MWIIFQKIFFLTLSDIEKTYFIFPIPYVVEFPLGNQIRIWESFQKVNKFCSSSFGHSKFWFKSSFITNFIGIYLFCNVISICVIMLPWFPFWGEICCKFHHFLREYGLHQTSLTPFQSIHVYQTLNRRKYSSHWMTYVCEDTRQRHSK